jgi:hypothetical protein
MLDWMQLLSATEPLLEWNSGHSFALAVPPPVQLETHPVLAVCALHHQLQELRMMELPAACFCLQNSCHLLRYTHELVLSVLLSLRQV